MRRNQQELTDGIKKPSAGAQTVFYVNGMGLSAVSGRKFRNQRQGAAAISSAARST